jgi:electron transfer flavoprotein alpha subunit
MRIAVLVKQIPRGEDLEMVSGRLKRTSGDAEVNAFCRRANAKAVELAEGGEVVVFSMGPPGAEDALREMIACGATRGVHLCNADFAGSDTLATAKALAVAIVKEGSFDLVLCGLNSLDADTGQVGPEVAELLGFPFAVGATTIQVHENELKLTLETDEGFDSVEVSLPAVVSVTERLCDPSKADRQQRDSVERSKIKMYSAFDLGLRLSETGQLGSPTNVGPPRQVISNRVPFVTSNPSEAVSKLREIGALGLSISSSKEIVPEPGTGQMDVWCFLDPDLTSSRYELLGEAASLASQINGSVTAVVGGDLPDSLGAYGADRILRLSGNDSDTWGRSLAQLASIHSPRVLLVDGTRNGRTVASKVAARHGWGLTGDGIETEITPDGSLTVWKPALGGRVVVPIWSRSPVQIATIRPGVIAPRTLRLDRELIEVTDDTHQKSETSRVRLLERVKLDTARRDLLAAPTVIGIGRGVDATKYDTINLLKDIFPGAEIGATRKVTDAGWMPRSRQIGITGLSVRPRLFISIGAGGRFNHLAGFQTSQFIFALNSDPEAEIFQHADVGLVGEWSYSLAQILPLLADSISQ